jgi:nucleotide-binding universal stress UspA family protein
MFAHILVAVDGSPTSNRGLRTAIELAADQKATLHIVNVVDALSVTPPLEAAYIPGDYLDEMIEALRQSGRKILAKAQAQAAARAVNVKITLVESVGHTVAHAILSQARKLRADVIVLGTHGRRGLSRALMGSDAEMVVREARIPVLLVHAAERTRSRPATAKPAPKRRAAARRASTAAAPIPAR